MSASAEICLRIGQRVRHLPYQGQRTTGVVHGLAVDGERGLMVDMVLDTPIVIPATAEYPAVSIYRQHAQAHEFTPLDERDELIEQLVDALRDALDYEPGWAAKAAAAVAKAIGSAA